MHLSRNRRLAINTITSLIYEVTVIICGFIVPRFILKAYGSETNGLISSITQFLGVISFLEMGVGTVVQTSLYKPLSLNDNDETSKILSSSRKYFGKIATALAFYAILLCFFYPSLFDSSFDSLYVISLIIILSAGTFTQYAFGISNNLLLYADQKSYILFLSRIVTIILNTLFSCFLIIFGAGIHVVKLFTAIINISQVIFVYAYVKRNYRINRKIKYDKEPIVQKWNGIAQHIAYVVLDRTDTIVLTVFATLADVSVYSVYYMVVFGIKTLFLSLTSGLNALLGDMWAREEKQAMMKAFSLIEWGIHTGAVCIFGITCILIVPFVHIYTLGITDTNYIQPLFATLICIAYLSHSLRLPYNLLILAAGHYKQTQRCYIIAALINIIISVIMVNHYGLIGVAIGTVIAMTYQTLWMGLYNSKYLLKYPFSNTLKQITVDIVSFSLIYLCTKWLSIGAFTYYSWIALAIKVSVISLSIVVIINMILYKQNVTTIINYCLHLKPLRKTK